VDCDRATGLRKNAVASLQRQIYARWLQSTGWGGSLAYFGGLCVSVVELNHDLDASHLKQ